MLNNIQTPQDKAIEIKEKIAALPSEHALRKKRVVVQSVRNKFTRVILYAKIQERVTDGGGGSTSP